jgi:hypothetical protein
MRPPPLFAKATMRDLIEHTKGLVTKEVDDMPSEYLLGVTLDDVCRYLEDKYKLELPVLGSPEIAHQEDVEVDVRWQRDRYFRPGTRTTVKGVRFTLALPFEGDPDLFQFGTYGGSASYGTVVPDQRELHLYAQMESDRLDHAVIDKSLKEQVAQVNETLSRVKPEVDQFQTDLPRLVRELTTRARERAEKSKKAADSLSFPLRAKPSPAQPIPVKRKQLVLRPPPRPQAPEPRLEIQEYDEILQMIAGMSTSMERTPAAYSGLTEEFLRDHFLAVLNANFEGAATGETFNVGGKTDILIRVGDRNVFVAECKFWKGPEAVRAAIDQLLGYLSWRDTKTALIVFNRQKDFEGVLAKTPAAVAAHPNHVARVAEYSGPNRFRFRFRQKDADREMLLTVMLFNVPS